MLTGGGGGGGGGKICQNLADVICELSLIRTLTRHFFKTFKVSCSKFYLSSYKLAEIIV